MKLSHENRDQLTVMTLNGELTSEETDPFRKVAMQCLDEHVCDFVLDVSALEVIDSKGLETLLWLQELAAEQLGQVKLAGPSDDLKTIMHMTRLVAVIDCHDDVESAISSLN